MSNNSQLNNIGEQMIGALNEALTTGNYENLKSVVSDTVTYALNEAGQASSRAWQQKEAWKRQRDAQNQEMKNRGTQNQQTWNGGTQNQQTRNGGTENQQARNGGTQNRQAWNQRTQSQQNWNQRTGEQAARNEEMRRFQQQREEQLRQRNMTLEQQRIRRTGLVVDVKNNGFTAGVLFIVFGAIANVPLFVLSLVGIINGWSAVGYLLFFLFVSIFFICYGKSKIQLIEKAKRYVRLCGMKMYGEVEELASQVGVSTRKVEKELRRILQKGIIPSAHMDKMGTHLMLNEVVYKQYMDAEKARVLREQEEKEKTKNKAKLPKEPVTEEKTQQETEFEQMIREGQECIRKLRYMNDLIPGEVISLKLDQLENLLREIFERVQKEPAQMKRMHKVMSYYLPTTLKLVEAYYEFDIISRPNEEILSAKKEIEATMDTINEAFEELLNNLFLDKVYDVTTDAQVLQTMLASEGLTKEMDLDQGNN